MILYTPRGYILAKNKKKGGIEMPEIAQSEAMRISEQLKNVIEGLHSKSNECIKTVDDINSFLFGQDKKLAEMEAAENSKPQGSGWIEEQAQSLAYVYHKLEKVQEGLNKLRREFIFERR